jgi:hypothetical protein
MLAVVTRSVCRKASFKKGSRVSGKILGHVARYCEKEGLPPLTALVVKMHKGVPGPKFNRPLPNADREQVFSWDWYAIFPPTLEELQAEPKRTR